MRFSQSVASDGSPCKSRSPENGRESLDGRRESIEALLHGRTEGEDRLGLYTIPESGRESLEDSSESIEALEDRRESIEALLHEEEMSSAPRSAYVSSSGDRASPSHDEEERSDGEPMCVLQEADEPDCLAINEDESSGNALAVAAGRDTRCQGDVNVIGRVAKVRRQCAQMSAVHLVQDPVHDPVHDPVQDPVQEPTNLLAITDAGAETCSTPAARLRQVGLSEANPLRPPMPITSEHNEVMVWANRAAHSTTSNAPCIEDASRGLACPVEDQKTPCRISQDARSSRPRPSNTPALPTPEYPSASRVGSRCRSEAFSAASITGERAAKPQRSAPKRGAINAGLQAAKPRRRKLDSGGV